MVWIRVLEFKVATIKINQRLPMVNIVIIKLKLGLIVKVWVTTINSRQVTSVFLLRLDLIKKWH